MKRHALAAALAGLLGVATLSACVEVTVQDDPPPTVIDVMATPPGSAPLPTNRAEFDKELLALSRVLRRAESGRQSQSKSEACERLPVLRRYLTGDEQLRKVGVHGLERTQLAIAGAECPKEPQKAARELRAIVRGDIVGGK